MESNLVDGAINKHSTKITQIISGYGFEIYVKRI